MTVQEEQDENRNREGSYPRRHERVHTISWIHHPGLRTDIVPKENEQPDVELSLDILRYERDETKAERDDKEVGLKEWAVGLINFSTGGKKEMPVLKYEKNMYVPLPPEEAGVRTRVLSGSDPPKDWCDDGGDLGRLVVFTTGDETQLWMCAQPSDKKSWSFVAVPNQRTGTEPTER